MRQFNMGRIWESGNFDITFKQLRSNLKFRGLFPLPFVNGYPVSAADWQRRKYCVLYSSAFL
jgi:hypothetical protein